MKIIFSFLFLWLFYSVCIAQNTVYKYTLLRNNPESVKNLNFTFFPFYGDINGLNINLGYGGACSYSFKNMISFYFQARRAYYDQAVFDASTLPQTPFSVYKPIHTSNYEFMGKIGLKKQIKEVKESVHLKFTGNGSSKVDHRVLIPAKRLYTYNLRFGYISDYSTVMNLNNALQVKGYDVNDANKNIINFSEYGGEYSDIIMSNFIVFGVSMNRISDIKAKIDGFKKDKGFQSNVEYYFDLLYTTKIELTDMYSPAGYDENYQPTLYARYNVNEFSEKSPFGFRIGFDYVPLDGFSWYGYGVELGMKPGLKAGAENVYLKLKFCFNLSARIGNNN